MAKALISIDYTHDFVADDGKLTAGKSAQAIEKSIACITREAYESGDYIFFAIDCHDKNNPFHPETKLFPPHNIKGTNGRNLYGQLADVYEMIKKSRRVFWLDKCRYSAFAGTRLDILLRERRVTTLVLTGVLADICILHTAIEAYHLGYQLEIPAEAVASLTKSDYCFALNHFRNVLGAKII